LSASQVKSVQTKVSWKKNYRPWKIVPTLLRHNPLITLKFAVIGALITATTITFFGLGILNEMSGIVQHRPLDVYLFIIIVSIFIGSAILFYPLLLLHYRCKIYLEEETERLNVKYREGLQEFQLRKGRGIKPPKKGFWRPNVNKYIADSMSRDNPDYQDFGYLYTTYLEILAARRQEIDHVIQSGYQTYEQIKKDIIRELIYATAMENLEFSAYDLSSYLLPVSYCMITVSFGIIILSLIPLLGTGSIQIGGASLNLVWAAGGFIGAYIYSFFPFFQRCTRGDMPPRAFLHYALKIFLGPTSVAVFGNFFLGNVTDGGTQFALAVALGSVPLLVLAYVREQLFKKYFLKLNEQVGCHDVFTIPGITYEYAERLHEEGIMNVQNLAFVDPENLSKRTMLNKNMLFDWKNRAILKLLTGNIITKNLKPSGESANE
jgi:hypothetical protein